jgi:O-acetyl-ADP-ribose deacetylase (regulator of RNase III)
MTGIEIHTGDITGLDVDAIVNAANERLAPGGGVCGAIHRAAGPELARECAKVGPCPTGDARITNGYDLPAKWVIHAVGPVWHGGNAGEDAALEGAYRAAMRLAAEKRLSSIAFPAISTGIFGFPLERATAIAVRTVRGEMQKPGAPGHVVFCCFGKEAERAYRAAIAQ